MESYTKLSDTTLLVTITPDTGDPTVTSMTLDQLNQNLQNDQQESDDLTKQLADIQAKLTLDNARLAAMSGNVNTDALNALVPSLASNLANKTTINH